MHSRTPWVNPTPSRTPPIRPGAIQSDRLPQKPQQQKQKGPKSPQVKRLESVLSGLRSLPVDGPLDQKGPDPKGGCFCQGRTHALSTYTPVCHTCGLPLCSINLPYHPCPHPPCRASLLSSTPDPFRVQIKPLIARIENEIRDQLKKEENERILAAEELRMREGAFPTLRPSPSPSPSPSPGTNSNQGYAVMSLTGPRGGKRSQVTVASYRPGNISKSSSSSSLNKKDAEADEVVRVRCPPSQVEPIKAL